MKPEFSVNYLGEHYNIKRFLKNHPGGINYVRTFRNKNVREQMLNTNHAKCAFYLLREYKIGGRNDKKNEDGEDIEKLVDWNKPMLGQVTNLGSTYSTWVLLPVDRQLRLFQNAFLENLTLTPWYLVPIVWIPIILFLIIYGSFKYKQLTKDETMYIPVSSILIGVIMWTLIEYSLHRWVFHVKPSGSSKILIYIHFLIHGLHHKVPFDKRRLVFPPLPAAGLAYAGYSLIKFFLPESVLLLITAGALLGYVIYDMIHYYLHSGSPKEGSYLYNMKRYHNQHHFNHHDSGFGISSKIWDIIFGTLINLRKLAHGIKW